MQAFLAQLPGTPTPCPCLPCFRFLVRLLLIHGRWSYKRCVEVVHYAFYKNLVYVLAYVLFSCFCGFSAQAVFPAIFLATYNASESCGHTQCQ